MVDVFFPVHVCVVCVCVYRSYLYGILPAAFTYGSVATLYYKDTHTQEYILLLLLLAHVCNVPLLIITRTHSL